MHSIQILRGKLCYRYKAILFPTLVAVCFENTRNSTILQQEVSTDLLIEYLRIELLQKDDTTIKAQGITL